MSKWIEYMKKFRSALLGPDFEHELRTETQRERVRADACRLRRLEDQLRK